MDPFATPCIRCGKTRVLSRKWKGKSDGRGSMITYEEYVCVDSECQKVVDAKFEEMRNRRLGLEVKRNNIKIARTK